MQSNDEIHKQEDAQIVEMVLSGNKHSFALLVTKYQKPIFNLALRMTRNRHDAEDLTQTVFMKAFVALRQFDPKFKFFTWLYRIGVNETSNFLKARKPLTSLENNLDQNSGSSSDHSNRMEIREIVYAALNKLPIPYRVLIVLKYINGLSYNEIADVVKLPVKKVKSRLFSARTMLRDQIQLLGGAI